MSTNTVNYTCGWHDKDAKGCEHGNELIGTNGNIVRTVNMQPDKRVGFSVEVDRNSYAMQEQLKNMLTKNRVSYEERGIAHILGGGSENKDISRITFMNIPADDILGLKNVVDGLKNNGHAR